MTKYKILGCLIQKVILYRDRIYIDLLWQYYVGNVSRKRSGLSGISSKRCQKSPHRTSYCVTTQGAIGAGKRRVYISRGDRLNALICCRGSYTPCTLTDGCAYHLSSSLRLFVHNGTSARVYLTLPFLAVSSYKYCICVASLAHSLRRLCKWPCNLNFEITLKSAISDIVLNYPFNFYLPTVC